MTPTRSLHCFSTERAGSSHGSRRKAAARSRQVDRRDLDRVRFTDGDDRHVDRERRLAVDSRRARCELAGDHLDLDRVHDRDGAGHAADRLSRIVLWPEAGLPRVADLVHARIGALRHRAVARDAGVVAHRAGPRRRRVAADAAGDLAADVSACGAGHGDGHLLDGHHGRPCRRPRARRLHHRQRVVAVDLLRQLARRIAGHLSDVAQRARAGRRARCEPRACGDREEEPRLRGPDPHDGDDRRDDVRVRGRLLGRLVRSSVASAWPHSSFAS